MRMLIFIVSVVYLQGCTHKVIELAEGGQPIDPQCLERGVEEANPWWYAAIPIAVPLDIIGVSLFFWAMPLSGYVADGIAKQKQTAGPSCESSQPAK